MPKKVKHTRISVTLTESYLAATDHLIAKGLYLGRGEIILEALRNLFEFYGIEPFTAHEQPEEPR